MNYSEREALVEQATDFVAQVRAIDGRTEYVPVEWLDGAADNIALLAEALLKEIREREVREG